MIRPAKRTPGGSSLSGRLSASPATNNTIPTTTTSPSPCNAGFGSVVSVDTRITNSAINPKIRSARGGPLGERRGNSRRFTVITVGTHLARVMGAGVEAVSTHGWRSRFDPRADDGSAPVPDAVEHDHELA